MKKLYLFTITLLLLFSCNKDDEVVLNGFSGEINFDVSELTIKITGNNLGEMAVFTGFQVLPLTLKVKHLWL